MRPKTQKPLVFINECGCIFDEEMLSKAMLWFSGGTLKSPRKIYLHGLYPAISICDMMDSSSIYKKIHVHRLIGLYIYRHRLVDGLVVHHRDRNRLNAMPENLQLMSQTIHASHHNKGKKLTSEHKAKIGKANKRRRGMRMKRKYSIPRGELKNHLSNGLSISAIARIYGCCWDVVKSRITENPELLK